MEKNDTNIYEPDGVIFRGEKVGQGDWKKKIRKPDGIIFRGEQMGYVDNKGKIRQRDGFVFSGEKVGQIKGNKAHDMDGIIFKGEEWGYVDENGNIRQRDGIIFKGRVIGKMRGKDKTAALGFFILRFKEMEDRFKVLKEAVDRTNNKTPYIGQVQKMLKYVPETNALGDFDRLIRGLKDLEYEVLRQFEINRSKKEQIVRKARLLKRETTWKETAKKFRQLQEEWKQIRSAGRDHENRLWQEFRSAQDEFYQRRSEHFAKEQQQRAENQRLKEQLCAMAESLRHVSDTRAATERVKGLQADWKAIGPVPKDQNEALWHRFRSACDHVFENARKERERKAMEWEKRNRERMDNLRQKEGLCSAAESLARASDAKSATARIKELQVDWKSIGPVPKEYSERVWDRFRSACDRVFENAREERERKQTEWRKRMEEVLERKRDQVKRLSDSIAHDEGNIDRWEDTISNLHDGGRADEIRDSLERKISDVEDKIRSKQDRLDDLKDAINEIERKLYR